MAEIYNYAHHLIAQFGDKAQAEVDRKIANYANSKNYNGLKTWYEIEAALTEITKIQDSEANGNRIFEKIES